MKYFVYNHKRIYAIKRMYYSIARFNKGWLREVKNTEAVFSDVNMGGITPEGALNGSESCLFVFG